LSALRAAVLNPAPEKTLLSFNAYFYNEDYDEGQLRLKEGGIG
jgi:hypothetical protein